MPRHLVVFLCVINGSRFNRMLTWQKAQRDSSHQNYLKRKWENRISLLDQSITTVRLRARMRAAALTAARRCSSSCIRFCLQNLAISCFVTHIVVFAAVFGGAQNLGGGGNGGGGGCEGEVCFVFAAPSLPSGFISSCFIFQCGLC